MVRKKNWQQEYKDFFNSLDNPWDKLYKFKSSSGNCPEEKIKICEAKGKVCNIKTNRCINPPKGVPKKNLTETKKSKQRSQTRSRNKEVDNKEVENKEVDNKEVDNKEVGKIQRGIQRGHTIN